MNKVDLDNIEKNLKNIIDILVKNKDRREELEDTPQKIAESYLDIFSGIEKNPREEFKTKHKTEKKDLIIERGIDFYSMCEHHFLPFFGTIDIAYVPNGTIVGFGAIIRVVETLSRRPQIQERLTSEIADVIFEELECSGVMVIAKGRHTCMKMIGTKKINSSIVTTSCRGIFETDNNKKMEVLAFIEK
ncbi:MAG: GTP cyclohydrolase I [Fusobacteriaceae bacterium]|jgi:GTP cyclohydrolase I|nr:GTP cyclohydrolase I [Fusobacteriaceae bacterium]